MAASSDASAIGFPPPLLGAQPLRLPVLGETADWLALNKPAGVGVREYPWDLGVPNLDTALNQQLQEGKPELLRTQAALFGSVYYLDPVISGVAVFGKNRAAVAALRNAYGSGHCDCCFYLLARHAAESGLTERLADAPLLPHNTKPKMIPSTAKGKRATTTFHCSAVAASGWALWQATTTYFRPHQVRAHAATLEMPILGDTLYGGLPAPSLHDLDNKKRGPGVQTPLFEGVALHLAEVRFPETGPLAAAGIQAALPRSFAALLKRLGLSLPGSALEG